MQYIILYIGHITKYYFKILKNAEFCQEKDTKRGDWKEGGLKGIR